ncbi:two-component sensor histidine kinase [Zhengella mangrovi]|uniref:histidine kinase n=1 Tax=Zhengella mangrovi TaxID=1982044 RepID=A0A2G1QTA8_9HYPH|nr:cache domain-containing protein [Zhengella mangrovi]PHP68787.1 two-component sensor histidine kinase [Zhengella mangrovi]
MKGGKAPSQAGQKPGKGTPVRYRLLAIALLPMLVIIPILLGATMLRWNTKFDSVLISKVRSDLTVAHQYFSRILENTGDRMKALGESVTFRDAVSGGSPDAMAALLEDRRGRLNLDFLYIVTIPGDVVAAAGGMAPRRTDMASPVLASAAAGSGAVAIDILTAAELADISPALAERASLPIVATPNAAPSSLQTASDGMVVHAATPVEVDGRHLVLVGGILLNRNLDFIDTINDLVYQPRSLPEGSQGTATLFLGDVRVSTNVRLFEGRRALGTRVSAIVRRKVLDEGQVWLDRAFVVNDWYISAYEPIVDSRGKRVGMLYVGFLEAPFQQTKYVTIALVVIGFVAVAALTVPLFLRWAGGIFLPLERMAETIDRVETGNLTARTGIPDRGDEISQVASHLDELLDRLDERDRQLREWNGRLNQRVEERTAELREANRQLESATKQLVMSEKLAAIGEITAGVAHEINNPIAVIQGNLEVLRDLVGEKADLAKTEFHLIDEQTERMRQIVTRLLQFARPDEYSGSDEASAPAAVFSDCLPLIRHMIRKNGIEVVRQSDSTRSARISRTELQQVLVNLMVNAIHAMPDGGTLTLACEDADRDGVPGVLMTVRDTGTGMAPDVAARIFDPFFTTKRGSGTGLGLSITHMLVSGAGGVIEVDTAPGQGTGFLVWLPEQPAAG